MLFHSIIFSMNDPKENCYVYMLMMLLQSLLKTKTLQDTDVYFIMVDPETQQLLETIAIFNKPNIKFISMPKPTTILEGMAWRYQLHRQKDIIGQTVVYMDIDMLCVQNMKVDIPDTTIDMLIVFPEGKSDDSNYAGAADLQIPYGVSSGFFVYKCGYSVVQFMEEVYHKIRNDPVQYYTLDQPHFNKTIENKNFVSYMKPNTLSFNGHNIDLADPPVFINCCGDPGSGHFHLLKMLQFFIGLH